MPNTSKSRVYNWIKQYDLEGLEGLKWRADERKLGKLRYVEEVGMGIKDLIVGILLEKPHVERVFKRFQHDFVESLPNFIGHNVAERKGFLSIKSFEDRVFGKQEILYMTDKRF